MLLSIRSYFHFRCCANFLIGLWCGFLYAKIDDSSESVPNDGWECVRRGTGPPPRITLRVKIE
jgi:hypothetical protein